MIQIDINTEQLLPSLGAVELTKKDINAAAHRAYQRTAKAVQMGEEVAAISTLALCINGIFTAFIIPLLLSVLI